MLARARATPVASVSASWPAWRPRPAWTLTAGSQTCRNPLWKGPRLPSGVVHRAAGGPRPPRRGAPALTHGNHTAATGPAPPARAAPLSGPAPFAGTSPGSRPAARAGTRRPLAPARAPGPTAWLG